VIFTQYYLDCLSQASYLIGDETTGRAVVVDPRRDIDEYRRDAEAQGLAIELVLETHFHADFLSGHLELAEATGAEIGYGSAARPEFAFRPLHDGERLSLGEVTLEIRETPGHTPESISIVVYERAEDEVPYGVLTGDTLFIGDVGRPDLLSSVGVTAEELAGQLYRSVHDRLLDLPDATRVFPGHGAGSACGKNLSTATQSTMGEQRATNYALRPMTEAEFVAAVTEGQPSAPGYFSFDATRNRQAHDLHDAGAELVVLDHDGLRRARAGGAVVVDTRPGVEFAAGHLAGSLNVGLDGRFAEYVGSVVPPETPMVLVCDPGTEAEARVRLARIGYDHVLGALAEPERVMLEHPEEVVRSTRITAADLRIRLEGPIDVQVVDVRNQGEVALGGIEGAVTVPLPELRTRLTELDPQRPTVVTCAGGYRSVIGASLLAAHGFEDVSDLLGGFGAWVALDEPAGTAV
jgi:glyoxylase-like metal-dependent hydrolase (beta-lactamase superfamily II)/rhodanese-related sulfurtransferase